MEKSELSIDQREYSTRLPYYVLALNTVFEKADHDHLSFIIRALIAKTPNFWALSMHFLWKTKMLITFEP